jgi:hypothetical protein
VSFVVGGALDWLAGRLQPSGDAAVRGLEQDLSRETTLDGSWWRICETAWALAFVELQLVPTAEGAGLLAARHDFAPRPWPSLDHENGRPAPQSTWAFHLTAGGRVIATLTARRRLGRVDFEPLKLVAAIQGVIDRFVVVRSADVPAPATAEPVLEATAALTLVGASAPSSPAES